MNKNKYIVRWLTSPEGGMHEEEYTAEGVNVSPGGAIFFNKIQVKSLQLSTTPASDQGDPVDVVGVVTGFISLKKV
jgi:hypothetical protein